MSTLKTLGDRATLRLCKRRDYANSDSLGRSDRAVAGICASGGSLFRAGQRIGRCALYRFRGSSYRCLSNVAGRERARLME